MTKRLPDIATDDWTPEAEAEVAQEMNEELLHDAKNGSYDNVLFGLDHGADINCQDDLGYTPLMLATLLESEDVVELLLERGADITLRNHKQDTALMIASFSDYESKEIYAALSFATLKLVAADTLSAQKSVRTDEKLNKRRRL